MIAPLSSPYLHIPLRTRNGAPAIAEWQSRRVNTPTSMPSPLESHPSQGTLETGSSLALSTDVYARTRGEIVDEPLHLSGERLERQTHVCTGEARVPRR